MARRPKTFTQYDPSMVAQRVVAASIAYRQTQLVIQMTPVLVRAAQEVMDTFFERMSAAMAQEASIYTQTGAPGTWQPLSPKYARHKGTLKFWTYTETRNALGRRRRRNIDRRRVSKVFGEPLRKWTKRQNERKLLGLVTAIEADARGESVIGPGRGDPDAKTGRVLAFGGPSEALSASARRVFWIVDNGSSHRGEASIRRLEGRYENLRLIHCPVHSSWLNQVEIYFSIVQRKVLTPNDFTDLEEVEHRLAAFERLYQQTAKPFEWKFTRSDLAKLMERLAENEAALRAVA